MNQNEQKNQSQQSLEIMIGCDSLKIQMEKKTMTQKINMKQLSGALLSGLMLVGAYVIVNILGSHDAFAASNLGEAISSFNNNIKDGAKLVNSGLYIGGTAVAGAGLFSLKRHADNPGQESFQKGAARVLVGAALVGAPSVINQMINTTGSTGGNLSIQSVGNSLSN